jgi:two-component system NtrC family sensor kinase
MTAPRRWQVPSWNRMSVRHKLMALALLPLLAVLPLLLATLVVWGNAAFDRLLITKIRSDLAVAHAHFDQLLAQVGSGTAALADSNALHLALANSEAVRLTRQLAQVAQAQHFDYINLYDPQGQWVTASWADTMPHAAGAHHWLPGLPLQTQAAKVQRLDSASLRTLAPHLASRVQIPLIPLHATEVMKQGPGAQENRALVMQSVQAVRNLRGDVLGWLTGGILLNQNLDLIDHINQVVYPQGSLPLGSIGTATLFLDDVRITTNVQLFQNQRAIGTRVSPSVRDAVLGRGETWLDRAYVVNDWYVSGYEPLTDVTGQRVGMLYVGFLETPFRHTKLGMLALIVAIFAAVMMLAAWLSVTWARSLFQPLERMSHTMQEVARGRHLTRVGPLPVQDELGVLARHLDQLLDAVDDQTQTLQRWGQELDTKVAARTQELQHTQRQLMKSEKLAAIGQLTASVAHEINNPIAVMQGNLDLLRETLGVTARPVLAELQLLDQQVDRMRLIVTQLLQYARPNDYAGYVDAVDVNVLLADSLVLVEHQLACTGINAQTEFLAAQTVAINRQELQQVLINLLINAVQAMPEGGTLRLSTQDLPDPSGQAGVVIDIADTGTGLAETALERLFTPFFSTRADGNGLGLWISLGLVERYGGRITAHNRIDATGAVCGALFRVWLRPDGAERG